MAWTFTHSSSTFSNHPGLRSSFFLPHRSPPPCFSHPSAFSSFASSPFCPVVKLLPCSPSFLSPGFSFSLSRTHLRYIHRIPRTICTHLGPTLLKHIHLSIHPFRALVTHSSLSEYSLFLTLSLFLRLPSIPNVFFSVLPSFCLSTLEGFDYLACSPLCSNVHLV